MLPEQMAKLMDQLASTAWAQTSETRSHAATSPRAIPAIAIAAYPDAQPQSGQDDGVQPLPATDAACSAVIAFACSMGCALRGIEPRLAPLALMPTASVVMTAKQNRG
jgi:hypothetical protein